MGKYSIQQFFPLLFAMVAIVGMVMGAKLHSSLSGDGLWTTKQVRDTSSHSIEEALGYIQERYYGDLDQSSFTEEVVREMISELDPYSSYMNAKSDDTYSRYINGTYLGRGFELHSDSVHHIIRVFSNSPAHFAGISRGDVILKIDDVLTAGLSRDSIGILLDNQDIVRLQLRRGANATIDTISLGRAEVEVPIVMSKRIDGTDVIYVKIDRFSHGVFGLVMDELDEYKKAGFVVKDLIIDLRGNPGGVVEEVVKLLNQLVSEPNVTLLSTINSKGRKHHYDSNGRTFFDIGRVVCIIDANSASASEILAGSLQDLDRAVIIGTPSFGKGYIQQNFKLGNGSSINLTVGEYLLPSGRSIRPTMDTLSYNSIRLGRDVTSAKGVRPDIDLSRDSCAVSDQMLRAHLIPMLIENELIHAEILTLDQMKKVADDLIEKYKIGKGRCANYTRMAVSQIITDLYFAGVSNVSKDQLDNHTREAIDIITSERYQLLLK